MTRNSAAGLPTSCRRACVPSRTARCCAWWATSTEVSSTIATLAGLQGADVDELIARQVRVFAERGERFEWKLHAHDLPQDLAQRLVAAGFVPEDEESVLIAPVVAAIRG